MTKPSAVLWSLTLILGALATGCGGGNGGGGGSPTAPAPQVINVAGDYAGEIVFTAAQPPEHCLARALAQAPLVLPVDAVFQQQGSAVDGSWTGTQFNFTCQLQGNAQTAVVSWMEGACGQQCFTLDVSAAAGEPCAIQVCFAGHNAEARFTDDDTLEGGVTQTWETSRQGSGADLGAVVLDGFFTLERTG